MIIKRALSNIKSTINSQEGVVSKVLMPLIFLSSLKNYLFSDEDRSQWFSVSDELMEKARKRTDKIVLVLDMDETLIYSRSEQCPNHSNYFEVSNRKQHYFVQKRPYLQQFLQAASKVFIIYVYTAGRKQYADNILNEIDPKKLIEKRFYRESCMKRNGVFLKNLQKIKSLPNKMILLDDNTDSISFNAPNAVCASSFQGNQKDCQLPRLFNQLLKFYQ